MTSTPPGSETLHHHIRRMEGRDPHEAHRVATPLELLFDLMYLAPTRVLMTGLWSSWENASEEDIEAFLTSWRDSSINKLRMGYAQLAQLTCLVYYSDPASWTAEIYPGPPQHIPG